MTQMKNINIIGKVLLLFIMLFLSEQQATGAIQNVNAVGSTCISGWYEKLPTPPKPVNISIAASSSCSLTSNYYIPHAGSYHVETELVYAYNDERTVAKTASFYLSASQNIAQQSVWAPSGVPVNTGYSGSAYFVCQYLVDESTGIRYTETTWSGCIVNSEPLPPTPPPPDISCSINNGGVLSVSLGILDRSELPTVASSGTATSIPIPITCTGGDLTVNMKLSYTPITSGSSQAVKSSANGVGVAILYNDKMLSSTDNTSVNLLAGSNTLNLAFEDVRDASVEIKDIPTGAFSASAVLQMTQQ